MRRTFIRLTLCAVIGLLGVFIYSFSIGDDRNFQVIKNLDIFNAVYKELDMFYVDTINPEKTIQYGIEGMLSQTDPYTEYYPEDDKTLKEMTSGKFGGVGSYIRYYKETARLLYEGLTDLGFLVYGGKNAPYLWCQTPNKMESWEFFDLLLNRCQIVCTPGVGFGASGEGYVRFSAFSKREDCIEALQRINEQITL